jgi:hypothetical protein
MLGSDRNGLVASRVMIRDSKIQNERVVHTGSRHFHSPTMCWSALHSPQADAELLSIHRPLQSAGPVLWN